MLTCILRLLFICKAEKTIQIEGLVILSEARLILVCQPEREAAMLYSNPVKQ